MKIKRERLNAIKNIIRENKIGTQEELQNVLKERGYTFTQATLSRDIKYLKIIKYPDSGGNYIYKLQESNIYSEKIEKDTNRINIVDNGFETLEFTGNFAVIKTKPGYAMGIASEIDSRNRIEIIGTLAGDDTILILPREGYGKEQIIESLSTIIPNINN